MAHLGICRERLGRLNAAVKAYEMAVSLGENKGQAANNLAWLLATSPEPDTDDTERALSLARRLAGREWTAGSLDTLAAALAANGRFEEAVSTMDQALTTARQLSRAQRRAFQARRELYLRQEAYLDPRWTPSGRNSSQK